jgi:integrase
MGDSGSRSQSARHMASVPFCILCFLTDLMREGGTECGIDSTRISPHSLRKTFARAVYDASGNDLVRTQKVVQHKSPLTTARYLESTQSELDDFVLGLGAAAPAAASTRP